jgi:hypothetical protein
MILALAALAALSVVAVAMGPLGAGWIVWRVSANALNQTYGADAAQLLMVAPVALVAAWLWRQRHRAAAPLALGAGLATLYYAIASVLGPDYLRYEGNNERYFLLFLALVIAGWTVAAAAWGALDAVPPAPSRALGRGFAAVLVAGGGAISAAWLAQLLDLARMGALSNPADALAYAEAPGAFWTVRVVDLGFIAPACLAAGVGLWRNRPAAIKGAYALAAFITLQSAAVLAMGAVMLWRHDPTATPGLVYALAPITAGGAWLTWRLIASYARGPFHPPVPAGGTAHRPADARPDVIGRAA